MTLYGLVLAGGQSTRMGQDKGLLSYHGQPHRFYLADLLRPYCDQVLISVNAQQSQLQADRYRYLVDTPQYADMGPLGAVLGAHNACPEVSWLIVTCDLPHFSPACAQVLVNGRDPAADATAFFNPRIHGPEPLVAIYERSFLQRLPALFQQGETSLRRILARANVALLRDADPSCFHSADTIEDYRRALVRTQRK